MKFKLILKQALKDFKTKYQLYTTFTVFITISVAMILGLFSFQFNLDHQFEGLKNSAAQINSQIYTFPFISKHGVNSDTIKNHLLAEKFQVEDGEFTNYVFREILQQEFQIGLEKLDSEKEAKDLQKYFYRPFSDAELEVLWNDLGYDAFGNELETSTREQRYFTNNIINQLGFEEGNISSEMVNIYGQTLGINLAIESRNIFDANKQLKPNLEKNWNYLRYAAFEKMSFFTRRNDRWFSNEDSDQFYDRNEGYNDNLLIKYFVNKITTTSLKSEITYSYDSSRIHDQWRTLVGFGSGTTIAEALLPSEEWMEDGFNWKSNNKAKLNGWNHVPEIAKKNPLASLNIISSLTPEEIDPEVLANGTYGYLNPIFLKKHNLKLGDKISYYRSDYIDSDRTITIIGTAVFKSYTTNQTSTRSFLHIPFQALKMNPRYTLYYKDLAIKKYGSNYEAANNYIKTTLYSGFLNKLVPKSLVNNFIALSRESFDFTISEIAMSLYAILTYSLGFLTVALLFAVFYFITEQSIKMQKQTLWFLKSMGSTNQELSLITTISSLIPLSIGTVIGIIGSFGISQMMVVINSINGIPLDVSPFDLNGYAMILLFGILSISLLAFLLINFFIIKSGALTLNAKSKVSLTTKLYIFSKPLYKRLKPATRIGISFIAKNIIKNIMAFVILLGAFAVILFAVEFKGSAVEASEGYEKHLSPEKSLLFNQKNINDSVTWNFNFLSQFLPELSTALADPKMEEFNVLVDNFFASEGAKTTFVSPENKYIDVETNQIISPKITVIDNNSDFNSLFRRQLQELMNKMKSFFIGDNSYNLNPDWDLKNYYLGQEYINDLFTGENIFTYPDQIFQLSDEAKRRYARDLAAIILVIEDTYQVEIFKGNLLQLQGQMLAMIEAINNLIKLNFIQKFAEIKETLIGVKSVIPTYKMALDLFFNRKILPTNGMEEETFFSSGVVDPETGLLINGIGLDERLLNNYQKMIKPLKVLEHNPDDVFDNYYGKTSQAKKVRILEGYMSKSLADNLKIKNDQVIQLTFTNFAFDKARSKDVYFKVKQILDPVTSSDDIYFNKLDLFNYFKKELIDQVKLEVGYDQNPDDWKLAKFLNKRADYKFFNQSYRKLVSQNENAPYLFNNTVFSREDIPYEFSKFTLSSTLSTGYSILGYLNLPMFNYASQRYENLIKTGVKIFRVITEKIKERLDIIVLGLEQLLGLLIVITMAVSLILIMLILLENKEIILLFKSMGYRKKEVIFYLSSGYLISAIVSLIVGGLLTRLLLNIASSVIDEMMHLSLNFVWTWAFVIAGLGLASVFISATVWSVFYYTNKQEPKNAFASL